MRPTNTRHRFSFLVGLGAGLLALTACGSNSGSNSNASSDRPSSTGGQIVNVAIYNNFPPDAFIKDGKLTGWIPELTSALGKQSGLNFKVTQVNTFDGLIPGLQSKRYDMAPDTFYITAERLKAADMVTMSQVGTSFGANKSNPVAVTTGTDVCGHTIAALSGSIFPAQIDQLNKSCASAGKTPATTKVYPDDASAVESVITGRNDLYAGATDQVAYLEQQGKLDAQPFAYQKQLEAIAFAKGSKYAATIQAAMNALIQNGEYATIMKKWGIESMMISNSLIKR